MPRRKTAGAPGVAADAHRRVAADPQHRLVTDAAALCGARRVLLVLSEGAGLRVAGAKLPRGESAATLLDAVTPWLEDARCRRLATLRHGPRVRRR